MEVSTCISAIIRTKNSNKTLERCLKSIIDQTLKVDEIIIVDNASIDNTLEIAANYDCKILHYPTTVPFNYSKSLNLGIRQSKSQFLLIISSHCIFESNNSLQLMFDSFLKHPLACSVMLARKQFSHISIEAKSSKTVNWKVINRHNFAGESMTNSLNIIRKKDWVSYPFNEEVIRCEDMDWALHFSKSKNAYVLCLLNVYYYYENPYASLKKTLVDYVVISRNYYPKWRSNKGILIFLFLAILCLIKLNFKGFNMYSKIGLILIKDRIQPITIPSGHIKSY